MTSNNYVLTRYLNQFVYLNMNAVH